MLSKFPVVCAILFLTTQLALGYGPFVKIERDEDPDYEIYSGALETRGTILTPNDLAAIAAKAVTDMMAIHAHVRDSKGPLPGCMVAMQNGDATHVVVASVSTKKTPQGIAPYQHGEARCLDIFNHHLHQKYPNGGRSVAYDVLRSDVTKACPPCTYALYQHDVRDVSGQVTVRPPTPTPPHRRSAEVSARHLERRNALEDILSNYLESLAV